MSNHWTPCYELKKHNIHDGNSGVRLIMSQGNQFDDLVISDRQAIQVCLNCKAKECRLVQMDNRRLQGKYLPRGDKIE